MKAVVMAGGEGTRLRPMTANQPKPLLPVVNRPIMEHVLRLLKRHGFEDTVVTVQFLATLIRNYFGDGEELGMSLRYVAEEVPLGTAGSVKNAEEHLRGEPFIVISGDALTDIDLTDMVRFHRENGALVTIGLKRVANPLEFGIIIVDDNGRIQRFLEKPTWGQVFSDTVNTGIYIMEPEVLDHVAPGENVDWSGDVFPKLLKAGAPLYGYIADGYWEDVGTHESYLRAQADVLSGKVDVEIDGFEVSPGIWVAEGAEVDPEAVLKGPLYIGTTPKSSRVRSCASSRCSAATWSCAPKRSCTGPWCTTTCTWAPAPTCAAVSSGRTPTSWPGCGSRKARLSVRSASSNPRPTSPTTSRSTRSRRSKPARSSTPTSSGSPRGSGRCSGPAACPG